ncbi:uncharacterized protein LOC125664497 isoform X3 [Ostrea edulis]|uniref:uncharacterized protein LOC125664497 isoform X3 n=1 Tax=Ostrea edulis TaxID=37623 RepID=UPI0024AF4F59|nr:uncharacterized protein LOC125664497 isoform X3 [Ostrea edulis]
MYNKRTGCRSTLKVHVKAKSKSEKAKTKVDRIMEITKTTLNKLVELIDENADEEDMCQIEDGIKDFWKSSTGKKYVVFITQLLENLENKIKQNSQDKKIRIAITKRFLSLVLFIGKEYQATLEVDRGSLLFTFYFETRLGYDRFSEDMRKGVIQQELSDVVQYEPFLGIFKLKKDDVMVEVEECTRNETDRTDENIEKKSKSKTIKPDYGAGRVVVLDKTGKIRFFYYSKEFLYSETFGPRGITTDDMFRILVADSNDFCIHVIDRDGTPLSLIRNGDIHVPWTVNVAGDKLIIGDYIGGGILVLKYLE